MNYKELIRLLNLHDRVEVKERLTPCQRKAVNYGHAAQRCYQDQPHDTPYPFRPIRYYLIKTSTCPPFKE